MCLQWEGLTFKEKTDEEQLDAFKGIEMHPLKKLTCPGATLIFFNDLSLTLSNGFELPRYKCNVSVTGLHGKTGNIK